MNSKVEIFIPLGIYGVDLAKKKENQSGIVSQAEKIIRALEVKALLDALNVAGILDERGEYEVIEEEDRETIVVRIGGKEGHSFEVIDDDTGPSLS